MMDHSIGLVVCSESEQDAASTSPSASYAVKDAIIVLRQTAI